MSNLVKVQNDSPSSMKNQVILKSTVWIQNPVKIFDQQQQLTYDNNTSFKIEHRQYIIQKIKRRKMQNKKKIEIYGQSSSDSDYIGESKQQQKQQKEQLKQMNLLKVQSQQPFKISPVKNSSNEQQIIQIINRKNSKQKSKIQPNNNKVTVFLNEKKGGTDWIKIQLIFNQTSLKISHLDYNYYDINKLKIMFSDIGDKCFKLKINWKNQECIFGASYSNIHAELPGSFYIFSRIINQKIKIMGKKMTKFVSKPQGFPQTFIKNSFVYGKILKKSRLIGKWNEINAVINKEGLFYSKKLNQKSEILISRTSISQLWTRFQFQGEFIIFKIFNNSNSSKIELGIPIYNFMLAEGWIYYLYGLIFKHT